MRNSAKVWRRMTWPLDGLEKMILVALTVAFLMQVAFWVYAPSWMQAMFMISNLTSVAVFWRWFWLEGYKRSFGALTAMGYVIGKGLRDHGEVLISKHGTEYRITPLTESRDT